MKYLTLEQLKALSPQRRHALWKKVKALVGKHLDPWFDFEPDMLHGDNADLNNYRKRLERLVRNDGGVNPPKVGRKREPVMRRKRK